MLFLETAVATLWSPWMGFVIVLWNHDAIRSDEMSAVNAESWTARVLVLF